MKRARMMDVCLTAPVMQTFPPARVMTREPFLGCLERVTRVCAPLVIAAVTAFVAFVGSRLGFAPYQLVVLGIIVLAGRGSPFGHSAR